MSFFVDGPIATFEFSRPERLNAIDRETMSSLNAAISEVEGNESVSVLVIRGGRRAFASGGDLREFSTLDSAQDVGEMVDAMVPVLARLEALPCWTVAFLEGPAFGGGTETALACDFRIVTQRAMFGFTQARFFVTPGWGGLTRMIDRVGASTALKWLATNAMVSPHEGLNRGLVDDIVIDAGELDRFTGRLIDDREVIGALKSGVEASRNQTYSESIAAERASFIELWLREPHTTAIRTFLERE